MRLGPVILGIAFAGVAATQAQPYSIDWYTIDSGGGTSTGGAYTLSGTIGQPDASPSALSGGAFTLQGGFWPGIVVASTGEVPTLYLLLSGANVVISWSPNTTGFVLEQADSLSLPSWSTAPAGNPTPPISPAGAARFYRLMKP
jgi:hypothetical protein